MGGCPVVHFDQHSPEHAQDAAGQLRTLRAETPVFWTEAYGGFWVLTRYADVARVARDDATFSSFKDMHRGDSVSFSGVSIPPSPTRQLPIDIDSPELSTYRKMLAGRMAPARARALRPRYEALADHFIDRFIESGEAELVTQLASPVPTAATLEFLGLPIEDHELYAGPFHDYVAYPQGSEQFERAVVQREICMERVRDEVELRKREPRDDALTALVQSTIDGQPLPHEDVMDWVRLLLGGGIDTTTALIAHSLVYLDDQPQLREKLAADPQALELFMEEMLRVSTPTQALARTATCDVEIGGQLIRRGERVLLSWASANRDELTFTDSEDVVVDRSPNPHTAFGLGPHRCIGSHFARVEYLAVLTKVLTRLPDYRLVREGLAQYDTIGRVNGWRSIPARFTPGTPLGVPFA